MTDEQTAEVCHEANRAYCHTIGDYTQVAWDDAPEWQRESARAGVQGIREGRITAPHQSHESWCEEKRRAGWAYGSIKDSESKQHPCLVPYDELPEEQRRKDALFFAIVRALL